MLPLVLVDRSLTDNHLLNLRMRSREEMAQARTRSRIAHELGMSKNNYIEDFFAFHPLADFTNNK